MTKCNKHRINVATDKELSNVHYYLRVWIAARNLHLPRRNWLDEIADAFRDFKGTIKTRDGRAYEVPLVDDVFGNDPEMRWMSDYLRPDDTGEAPRRFTTRLERVRIIDLYFKIRHPKRFFRFSCDQALVVGSMLRPPQWNRAEVRKFAKPR